LKCVCGKNGTGGGGRKRDYGLSGRHFFQAR
jgi:hypothetical protein